MLLDAWTRGSERELAQRIVDSRGRGGLVVALVLLGALRPRLLGLGKGEGAVMRGRERVSGVGRAGRRSGWAAGLLRGRLVWLAVMVVVAGGAVASSVVWGAGCGAEGAW